MHLAAFGFILLLPAIVLAAIGISRYWEYERERLETFALDLAVGITLGLDRSLESTITLLKTLASSPALDEQLAAFHQRARLALQGSGMEIVLVDRSMRQVLSTNADYGVPLPAVVDTGTVERVLGTGHPQVSNLFVGRRGNPLFNIMVPVIRDGEITYVLVARQPTAALLAYVQRPEIGPEWTLGISDGADVVLTRSRESDRFVGSRLSQDALQGSTGTAGVHRGINLEGVEVLRSYARSDLSGWMVAAFVPVRVIEAPLRESWTIFALAVGGLFLLSILLASLVARATSRPIAAIRRSAVALGRGEVVAPSASLLREANEVAQALADASRERLRRDEQVRFLLAELSHRTKNLMAVILSIARQSNVKSGDWPAFERRFSDRLMALSRSIDLLVRADWRGADLGELVRVQLASFAEAGGGRLEVEGPPVGLTAQAAQQIGIALHELATNAAKYGALSVPQGRVRVDWRFLAPDGELLRLSWRESGGPAVAAPVERGFGSTILERIVPASLQGEAATTYAPEGLCWRIDLPRRHLIAESVSDAAPDGLPAADRPAASGARPRDNDRPRGEAREAPA